LNPIFKEYCKFLKDTVGLELEEGYYWLDNQIIKAFDKQGNVHKLYRIVIDDNLTVSYKIPNNYDTIKNFYLASWNDLVEMNESHLENIEREAKQLIIDKIRKFNGYIPLIPVSMGKDSQVTCHLVRECFPDTKAIFNNTTLDCADTYLMAKKFSNCEIMTPEQGFYQYIKKVQMIPTRFSRFCCRIFKVGEMVNQLDHNTSYLMFMGMRNEESSTRNGYGDEWINEAEWGNTKWQGVLPIRKWSELDVWLYTLWRDIEINSKYRKGYARVGCSIACPFSGKSTWILDKYWYPIMRKRWEDILKKDFIQNNKWLTLNCTIKEYVNQAWNGGVFREEPTQGVIREYCSYAGINENIATQYFNKYCTNGCKTKSGKIKKIKEKDVIGMNLKYHGRNINKFYCKKCLMKMYGWDDDKWDNEVNKFKQQGCMLF
jgi:3''-phosphoadenosine 5''-phosphosulfate sulfotransferase (PAPS reductase)/FAD synthetase and related enzymes